MKNVNELIPDCELQIVLKVLIEKEFDRYLDFIERANKCGALINDEDFAEKTVSYYWRRLEELATIYKQLFSEDLYR